MPDAGPLQSVPQVFTDGTFAEEEPGVGVCWIQGLVRSAGREKRGPPPGGPTTDQQMSGAYGLHHGIEGSACDIAASGCYTLYLN